MLPKHIPEERVPGILARAAELDRQTIPLDTLRSAAIEAGISGAALDQALAEFNAGGVQPASQPLVTGKSGWRRWLGRIIEPVKFGALAFIVGILGARDASLATVAVTWLIATAGYLAWRDRGAGIATRFQVNTLVMCAMLFAGLAGASGRQDTLGFVAIISIALLVLGTLIVHFGGEPRSGEEITAP